MSSSSLALGRLKPVCSIGATRHTQNMLIDLATAEVIHIDLGVAFEQGKLLKTPETVPFRLTVRSTSPATPKHRANCCDCRLTPCLAGWTSQRDIVDGMGVTGIDGAFIRSAEKTLGVLRDSKESLLTLLEVAAAHHPYSSPPARPFSLLVYPSSLPHHILPASSPCPRPPPPPPPPPHPSPRRPGCRSSFMTRSSSGRSARPRPRRYSSLRRLAMLPAALACWLAVAAAWAAAAHATGWRRGRCVPTHHCPGPVTNDGRAGVRAGGPTRFRMSNGLHRDRLSASGVRAVISIC